MKNKWKQFAKIFGVNLNQLFYIKDDEEEMVYRFTNNGLEQTYSEDATEEEWEYCEDCAEKCVDMLNGTIVVETE